MSAPPRGIIIKFAYESISLAMHNDRQTDERTDGRTALPAVDVMVAFADSHQECRRCCGCVAAAHKLWQLKSIN